MAPPCYARRHVVMTDRLHRLFRDLWGRRRLVAPIVLGAAVLVVGSQIAGAMTHDTDVDFDLGTDHADVTEARVGYVLDGEEMHGAVLTWAAGAPEHVRHQVSLPGGRYDVEIELRGAAGTIRWEHRAMTVPADARVRFDVGPAESR